MFRLNFTLCGNVKKPKDAILSAAATWDSGSVPARGREWGWRSFRMPQPKP